jgi:hypothetical protein
MIEKGTHDTHRARPARPAHLRAAWAGWSLALATSVLSLGACSAPGESDPGPSPGGTSASGEVPVAPPAEVTAARGSRSFSKPSAPSASPPADTALIERLRGEFDAAMQALGGPTIDSLWAELRPIVTVADPAERMAQMQAFDQRHGALVSRAMNNMKHTAGTTAFLMAQQGGEGGTANGEDVARLSRAQSSCETPYQWEPVPPYYEMATWGGGSGNRFTGSFSWRSESTIAFNSWDGTQFRADHFPWHAGQTTVTARYSFRFYSIGVVAFLSYAFADIHTRIVIADDSGAFVRDCPSESVRYVHAVLAAPNESGSLVIDRSCTYTNQAYRTYSSLVIAGGHTTAGGLSQAASGGSGVVESIRARTCY